MATGVLTFFCGKMGAGKTTKAREAARTSNAVLISEDEWLEAVYPRKIATLDDYLKCSAQLKPPMKKLVQSILMAGTDVVMDFPANTQSQRDWFRGIFSEIRARHKLIYIDLPDEICKAQVAKRRLEQPERAVTDTAEMFEQVTRYFVPPTANEGFNTLDAFNPVLIKEVSQSQVPKELLLLADPSEEAINRYLRQSRCFVAYLGDTIAGVCVAKPVAGNALELMNIAVSPSCQQQGTGSQLLQHLVETAKESGATRLEVGTGTFGYPLTFYQKHGFRITGINRDFFLNNYPDPVIEDGIQHKDMLRLTLEL